MPLLSSAAVDSKVLKHRRREGAVRHNEIAAHVPVPEHSTESLPSDSAVVVPCHTFDPPPVTKMAGTAADGHQGN